MTPQQVVLVQRTWRHVVPMQDAAAQLFYSKLFDMDPSLMSLFRGDMQAQREKLMKVLDFAVSGLNQLDAIVPAVQALGRRHAGYGVKDQHYETVGAALLRTLEEGLGAEFTAEVESAWASAYSLLAATMKDAAAAPAAPSAH